MAFSVVLDAADFPDLPVEIGNVRESARSWDYEIVVVDRGTAHRAWLAQQGDVVLITQTGERDLTRARTVARHGDRMVWDGQDWTYESQAPRAAAALPYPLPPQRAAHGTPPPASPSRLNAPHLRILHVSSFPDNTRGLTEGLQSLGEVQTFNWREALDAEGQEAMNVALEQRVLAYRPHIIFMEETFTGDVRPETLRRIKHQIEVGVANWCGDIRAEIPQSMLEMGHVVDWTLLSNVPQVTGLRQQGITAAFLPAGCDPAVYRPRSADRERFPADIIFLGSGRHRFPGDDLRRAAVERLYAEYGDRFRVYGRGWGRDVPYAHDFIEPQEAEALAYASCRVALGTHAFRLEGYTSARLWKAMGSGACYLSEYFPGVERWFVNQEHLALWRTVPELLSHLRYYLQRDGERERMAAAGQAQVHAAHTWAHRAHEMLRLLRGRKIRQY